MAFPLPVNEPLRLEALRSLQVLDTSQDPRFERLVQLATQIMGTPIALVSLVDADRQWFKAKVGLEANETSREIAFCAHAILSDAPLVVEDASSDDRFAENPLVLGDPGIRFYAGAPLISGGGYRLGTLCAIDTQPRHPTEAQIASLQTLAAIAVDMMAAQRELQSTGELLAASQADARERSLFVSSFAHELRTPLHHIIGFSEMMENGREMIPRVKIREYANIIWRSAHHLFEVVDRIMQLEKAACGADLRIRPVVLDVVVKGVVKSFETMVSEKQQRLAFQPSGCDVSVLADETSLRQIVINLISNASRYSPQGASIRVTVSPADPDNLCRLDIADTGPGISDEMLHQIGKPYLHNANASLRAPGSMGLGLRITKQLAESMDGNLQVMRGPHVGTIARLTMPVSGVSSRPENLLRLAKR